MNRPHIIINCAMSADGKIALPNKKQMKISSKEDIKRMYHIRNESDAVLVGISTVLSDDPKLTVKQDYIKNPKQPLRVILDSSCKTPEKSLVLKDKKLRYFPPKKIEIKSQNKDLSFASRKNIVGDPNNPYTTFMT